VKSFLTAWVLDKVNYASFLAQQNGSCLKSDLTIVQTCMDAKKALVLNYFQ
jgi:hypothetical protein